MPRTGSLLVPECPHHIKQRGQNENVVFLVDQDYLSNLKKWKQVLKVEIFGASQSTYRELEVYR
jgi:putative transposase